MLELKTYKSISEIGKSEWSHFVSKRFFLSYDYLLTLENACPGLEYRYVICYKNNDFQGLCYFQVIPFLGKNLFEYIPTQNRILSFIFRKTLGLINTKLLVLGNVIFTCENGFLYDSKASVPAEDIINDAIKSALKSLAKKPLATMISENIAAISPKTICDGKFHEFKVEDRMEIDLTPFSNFIEYTEALQSKYRVRLKKIYNTNLNTISIDIDSSNYDRYRSDIKRLFKNVILNSKFKLTEIDQDYFEKFELNINRFKIKGFVIDDQLVGFVTYFLLDHIIEVHYIGLDYKYNQSHKLYNFILYKILEFSFDVSINKICYGRTAQELKSTLGAKPYINLSSLKINQGFINLFIPIFLKRMIPETWILRNPFKI